MTLVIYPGSFDPISYGHINIVERASLLFDKVLVAIGTKKSKNTLFSKSERLNITKNVLSTHKNVEVLSFDGLLVDFYNSVKADAIIRGIRGNSDFNYEYKMEFVNRMLNDKIECIFLLSDRKYEIVSSSLIREIAQIDISRISKFVSPIVFNALLNKFNIKSLL